MKTFSQYIRTKALALIVGTALILSAGALSVGCRTPRDGGETSKNTSISGKKTVTVTTSFLRDIVNVLAGDAVRLQCIIPAGEDPHLYVAKPEDLNKIREADMLLYHGLHFEGKMVEILERRGISASKSFSEEEVGRMEQDGSIVVDPHFWFDISLYKKAVKTCAEALQELLPGERDAIDRKMTSYLGELDALDEENREKIASIPESQRILVTPHDAFNYFSRSYGVKVVAPQGVSTDSEVANADIEKTANYIVKHRIKAIFTESTTNPDRMKKLQEVCRSKGFEVEVVGGEGSELFSDSLAAQGAKGDTYLEMYRSNVDLIVNHLK